jgi:hypothetical protein
MRNTVVLIAILLFGCACMIGQNTSQVIVSNDDMAMQLPAPPPPPPDAPGAAPNVLFQAQKSGDNVTMSYFAVGDFGKAVTGAPYSATAVTETTQVLADGNRIVNKMESQVARDSQGRTRRQETMSNIGPLATNAPKMAFINDPVGKVSYVLDLGDKTAQVVKLPPPGQGPRAMAMVLAPGVAKSKADAEGGAIQKGMIIAGAGPGVEQRVWVNNDDASQVKTESLGTQTIEGVSATGTRTTRTIPAGEIGNERPLEITSEVWTSPDLQTVVLSKRSDPRMGETVYKLTNIQRADPDPSLFQVPSGFTTKPGPEFSTRQIPD